MIALGRMAAMALLLCLLGPMAAGQGPAKEDEKKQAKPKKDPRIKLAQPWPDAEKLRERRQHAEDDDAADPAQRHLVEIAPVAAGRLLQHAGALVGNADPALNAVQLLQELLLLHRACGGIDRAWLLRLHRRC